MLDARVHVYRAAGERRVEYRTLARKLGDRGAAQSQERVPVYEGRSADCGRGARACGAVDLQGDIEDLDGIDVGIDIRPDFLEIHHRGVVEARGESLIHPERGRGSRGVKDEGVDAQVAADKERGDGDEQRGEQEFHLHDFILVVDGWVRDRIRYRR